MDHEQAVTLITDLAAGRLDAALAADLERHVGQCEECRRVWEASSALTAQIRARGAEFLAPHPPASEIAAYAVYPERLTEAQLAAVEEHVRACPICGAEATTARQALRGASWRGWRASLTGADRRPVGTLLGPALAVLAVALVYPAYLGTFRYPQTVRELDRATLTADSLRVSLDHFGPAAGEQRPSPSMVEGGVTSLVLSGPSRASSSPRPVVRRRGDQRFLHVVIDRPLTVESRAAGHTAELTIVRTGEETPAWRLTTEVGAIWDEGLQAIGFMIPADRLSEGTYRLELRFSSAAPEFTAEFRVERAAR